MLKTAYSTSFLRPNASGIAFLAAIGLALGAAKWAGAQDRPKKPQQPSGAKTADDKPDGDVLLPCITDPDRRPALIDTSKIPRFVENSPFDEGDAPPPVKLERRLWAQSWLWAKAPDFVVQKWLTEKPDTKGKYVLIEFWATWCGPCRRSIPLLNTFHKKFGDELVVIGVCEEDEEAVRKMKEPKIDFYSAVDPKKRMKDKLGVWGIPHAILLEPDGYVIWEGFPLQKGYELTDRIIEKILEVGRKLRAGKKAAVDQ